MAALHGHHHGGWFYEIQKTYKKCPFPPWEKKRKNPRDKSALKLCATLIRETWRLFEKYEKLGMTVYTIPQGVYLLVWKHEFLNIWSTTNTTKRQ